LRIETTEKMRGLDTPAENAGYPGLATAEPGRGSTDFFQHPAINYNRYKKMDRIK
jgi:hypothetical protein